MAEASPRTLVRTIPPEWEGRTVRHYLGTELHISRTLISRIKRRSEGVCRNGTPCRTDERLRAGDVLAVQVGDEGGGNEAEPIPVPLRIVYEDEDLAVIDKPAGLAVHGVPGGAPGLRLSMEALSEGTSQLPRVSLEAPAKCIGTNTVACMQSGAIFGAAAMLDGMIDRMEEELGQKAAVIATGGLAGCVTPCCRREIRYEPDLLLIGLAAL